MTHEEFREITNARSWQSHAQLLLNEPAPLADVAEAFGTYWIVGGHHMREQIGDDGLLVRLLRHMLPAYEGQNLSLYRGENVDRWKAGHIGLAWTTDIDIARMFARGLNSIQSGGVLLECNFKAKAIIAGPNSHSSYLGEQQYTIDPIYARGCKVLDRFPPCL